MVLPQGPDYLPGSIKFSCGEHGSFSLCFRFAKICTVSTILPRLYYQDTISMAEWTAETVSRARAREIIEAILQDHGHLPRQVLDQIEEKLREQVIAALLQKDKHRGRGIIV
jgi:hypothetical protein